MGIERVGPVERGESAEGGERRVRRVEVGELTGGGEQVRRALAELGRLGRGERAARAEQGIERAEKGERQRIREGQQRLLRTFSSTLPGAIPPGGRYTKAAGIAALGAAVATPWVLTAMSKGADGGAVATLRSGVDFSVGYFVALVDNWLPGNHGSDPTDEETIRRALVEELSARLRVPVVGRDDASVSEAYENIRTLFDDDELVALALDAARVHRRELDAFRPAGRSSIAGTADERDNWLFEEIVEALEFLARLPSRLELALARVLDRMHNEGRS